MTDTIRITILGCGSSSGVPMVGCDCLVCTSPEPRNKRLRSSILIEAAGQRILVDTSPDLRAQALQQGLSELDAVIYTHAHADHLHGIDELRTLTGKDTKGMPVYATAETMELIEARFSYCFLPLGEKNARYRWFRPVLLPHVVDYVKPFQIGPLRVQPFRQHHGKMDVMGIRMGDFAYSTDVHTLPESSIEALTGIKLWVVDCLEMQPTPTHSHLEQTLAWIARVRPERAILTHMGHYLDYTTLRGQLPPGVEPAHDGMVLTCL